jgi:hypothetical protein
MQGKKQTTYADGFTFASAGYIINPKIKDGFMYFDNHQTQEEIEKEKLQPQQEKDISYNLPILTSALHPFHLLPTNHTTMCLCVIPNTNQLHA